MSGGNPVSFVTDPISKAIGTDGSGGGVLGALADIDPGPAIGKGLSEVDKFVGREIPGGWKTVGLAAAAVAAPYALGAMSTGAGASAGSFVAADAAGLAASGLSEAAIAQNLAMAGVESFVAADAAALAASGLSEAAIAQNLSYAYGADLATGFGANAVGGGAPINDFSQMLITDPQGPTYGELGITGLESGQMGPTYAELGYTGLNQSEAIAAADAAAKTGAGMNIGQGLRLAQLGRGLLGSSMPQQQNPYGQMVQRQQSPAGVVDYSGLLALLSPRSAQKQTSLLG